jgi:SRSO17 transposase
VEAEVLAQVEAWVAEFERLLERIGPRFARPEVRRRAAGFLRGLLGGVDRKNGWQLAEHASETTPDGMQRLLTTTRWDPDALRDDVRAYVTEQLGDPGGVLVVDETGFLKKGTKSAGVQRQYSGTAGRIENCQVGVFLAYASGKGRALVDRELYLPAEWAADPGRRVEAHVGERVGFATKPQLAQAMLTRVLDAGVPAGWVTADEVYGGDARLRAFLEQQDLAYVLAVKATQPLWAAGEQGPAEVPARQLVAGLPAGAWRRLSAGDGAKGPRVYDWARVALTRPGWPGRGFWLLVRRRLTDGELAFYACFGPARTTLAELVRIAGIRWTVEMVFPQLAVGWVWAVG